jgi:hypothetical protein
MSKLFNRIALGAAFVFASTLSMAADAPAVDQKRVDTLADRLVQMMPLGPVLDDAAKADPTWPMQEHASKVSPQQLACMRDELSTTGYRRTRGALAADYLVRHEARFDEDVKLLEQIAPMVGSIFGQGVAEAQGGKEVDAEAVMKDSDPAALLGFLAFISESKYGPLRELTGLGDAFKTGADESANAKAGEQVGQAVVMKLMLGAMSSCKVPTSALFE